MKFFPLDFFNRMSCNNRNGVMLVNIFFLIFSQFLKIRVKYPFNLYATDFLELILVFLKFS